MTKIYDAIIAGAGPAGSAAAISLARAGFDVLVLERSRFPRQKLCGEFITPECSEIFGRLGVADSIESAGGASIEGMNLVTASGTVIEIPMKWMTGRAAGALGLSRAKMDHILLCRAKELGATVIEKIHVQRSARREDSHVTTEGLDLSGDRHEFRARVVIDATGRSSAISRKRERDHPKKQGRLYALKAHLRGVELNGRGELYFFESGYGGLARIESGLANLCFITTEKLIKQSGGDKERLLDLTVRTNHVARERLGSAMVIGPWLAAGPLEFGRKKRSHAGVIAVGDASGMIDPFTGSGILVALRSGELAAFAVGEMLAMKRDCTFAAAQYSKLARQEFGRRYAVSSLLRRAALSPFLRGPAAKLLARHDSISRWLVQATRD